MWAEERRVRTYLQGLAASGVTGSFLIASQGTIVLEEGYGLANRAAGIPNTPETQFDIGSIAKIFTAIAVFQLEAAGRLTLEETLTQLLPAIPPDKAPISIHQLLTHTAGLATYHSDGDFDPMDRTEALQRCLVEPLRWPPGTREGYSNASYALLAAIVEFSSGVSFSEYIRTHILDRLSLTSTGWLGETHGPAERMAHGYVGEVDQGSPRDWPLTWALLGGGGMVSSVSDLYRLEQALQGDRLLPLGSRQRMYAAPLGKWASGWEIRRTAYGPAIQKGGAGDFGFTGQLVQYRDRMVVLIFLLNAFDAQHGNNTHNHVGAVLGDLLFAAAPE